MKEQIVSRLHEIELLFAVSGLTGVTLNYLLETFALQHTGNSEVAHIHIAVVQEIIRFLVVVLASLSNLSFIKRTLCGCCGSALS